MPTEMNPKYVNPIYIVLAHVLFKLSRQQVVQCWAYCCTMLSLLCHLLAKFTAWCLAISVWHYNVSIRWLWLKNLKAYGVDMVSLWTTICTKYSVVFFITVACKSNSVVLLIADRSCWTWSPTGQWTQGCRVGHQMVSTQWRCDS